MKFPISLYQGAATHRICYGHECRRPIVSVPSLQNKMLYCFKKRQNGILRRPVASFFIGSNFSQNTCESKRKTTESLFDIFASVSLDQ